MAVLLLALAPGGQARANVLRNRHELDRVNARLGGRVLDYTRNHGADRRIWSPALGERRDLYVYLPPGFDPCRRYPLAIWLHGFAQDESVFLRDVIVPLDRAILDGTVPPLIVAAPDGSLHGLDCYFSAGSFFLNSKAGRFEDFLMVDVWDFVTQRFPVRPEREAHAVVGVSMGAGAAYNKAFKYPDRIGVVVGLFPPLNWRWLDCHGRYRADFDPCCWGWRTDFDRRHQPIARYYGLITIRLGRLAGPLYSRGDPQVLPDIIANNPIEMLAIHDVRPGQFAMYIGYGGKDQFNIDAQVESFLYVAHHRGLEPTVRYDPEGKHDRATALRFMPDIFAWLGQQLFPFGPTEHEPGCPPGCPVPPSLPAPVAPAP
jgi:S-formylglutathione hydrolase FrmB